MLPDEFLAQKWLKVAKSVLVLVIMYCFISGSSEIFVDFHKMSITNHLLTKWNWMLWLVKDLRKISGSSIFHLCSKQVKSRLDFWEHTQLFKIVGHETFNKVRQCVSALVENRIPARMIESWIQVQLWHQPISKPCRRALANLKEFSPVLRIWHGEIDA